MEPWNHYVERYRAGEWRDLIFRDMILEDTRKMGSGAAILDIGCGRGLDGSIPLQRAIADAAGRYIGIDPDREITLGDYFTEVHRCCFEEAPLPASSIDLAYAVMVLEHLPDPEAFWNKLREVLISGGVFWGLTVDGRHPFCHFSRWAERLGLKNLYLDWMHGVRGEKRYENYPTHYRTNTPQQIRKHARQFRSLDFINFSRVGQIGSYLPRPLRPLSDALDRRAIQRGRPGCLLAIRVAK